MFEKQTNELEQNLKEQPVNKDWKKKRKTFKNELKKPKNLPKNKKC